MGLPIRNALAALAAAGLLAAPSAAWTQSRKPAAGKPAAAAPAPRPVAPGATPAAVPVPASLVPVNMFVGEVRTIPVRDVVRVAVGNGKVMTSTVLETEVLILAESPGDTSLFLWLKGGAVLRYRVKVAAGDTDESLRQLRAVLKDLSDVKVDRVGDQLVISGTASKADLKRIEAAAATFPRALNLAREEDLALKKMVYIKLQLMEFKKNALENLGIDWQTNIAGPSGALTFDAISNSQFRFFPGTVDPTFEVGKGSSRPLSIPAQPGRAYLGIASVITSRINLAVNNGDAWILAAPELSTRSGGEAKFLAGGQVPLPTVSSTGQSSVSFKDYGIRLTLKPIVDAADNIVATIQTELSAIDPSVTVQGIPGFTTRITDSEINVKSGQTIVMSGLVNQELNNAVNALPVLGELPVLGNLFKSTNFRNGRTDLVIFVTPTVTDPVSTQNRQRLEKAKDLREKFENFLGNRGIVD